MKLDAELFLENHNLYTFLKTLKSDKSRLDHRIQVANQQKSLYSCMNLLLYVKSAMEQCLDLGDR